MSCLGKILAGVVSHCLRRGLGFGVSFSHDTTTHTTALQALPG